MADPTEPTIVSIPNAQVKALLGDGTFSLPWRRFFQQLFTRTGGSADDNAATLNQLAEEIAAADAEAEQALAAANQALAENDMGSLYGSLGIADADAGATDTTHVTIEPDTPINDGPDLLGLLGLAAQDPPQPTGGSGGNFIAYDVAQSLTASQQLQAQQNLGSWGMAFTVNLTGVATASLPAPLSGTVMRLASASTQRLMLDGYAGATSQVVFRSASGTVAAPGALASGVTVGNFGMSGATGPGTYASGLSAAINFTATEAWSPTANGSNMVFQVTKNGGITRATALIIDNDGTLKQTTITVANLPSATTSKGARMMVTDATAPTVGATVVGGGTVTVPVYSDGANWICDGGASGGGGGGVSTWLNAQRKIPLASQFPNQQSNGGSGFTLTDDAANGLLYDPGTCQGSCAVHTITTGVNFSVIARIKPNPNAAQNNGGVGLCVLNSSSNKIVSVVYYKDNATLPYFMGGQYWTGTAGFNSAWGTNTKPMSYGEGWIRLDYVASTGVLTASYSTDGSRWIVFNQAALASTVGVPDSVGLFGFSNGQDMPFRVEWYQDPNINPTVT